jgi:hypothetical protein
VPIIGAMEIVDGRAVDVSKDPIDTSVGPEVMRWYGKATATLTTIRTCRRNTRPAKRVPT